LHAELENDGLTVVTVALDIEPAHAHQWIDAAAPTHPSLIDTHHVTGELFGFINIPMAAWIDESGMIVRNAESAAVVRSPLRELEIPDGLDDRMTRMLTEVKAIRDDSAAYRDAIVDWVHNGAASPFALSPDEVIARSRPRGADEAEAVACFELGRYLRATVGDEAAVPWWRRAHQLDPGNWTYKRQAWTLVTTAADATENDLIQGPNDVYAGNWLDDVVAIGGGANYYPPPQL
jgi:hypothetical protein